MFCLQPLYADKNRSPQEQVIILLMRGRLVREYRPVLGRYGIKWAIGFVSAAVKKTFQHLVGLSAPFQAAGVNQKIGQSGGSVQSGKGAPP